MNTSSISRIVRISRLREPTAIGGAPGRVTSIASDAEPLLQFEVVELGPASIDQALERHPRLVPGLPDRTALLRGELRYPAQDRGQLGLPAEVADPELFQRRAVPSIRDRGLRLRADLGYAVNHGLAPIPARDDIPCRAIAAAAATLSDSAPPSRSGIVTRSAQLAST